MLRNRRFECYIIKNRIVGVVLSLLMAAFMTGMAIHFDLPARIDSKSYRTIKDIENRQSDKNNDVTITVDRADYAGYECYENSERQGRYYYCQQDGRFAILLLRSDDDVVLNYTIRGRVISDQDTYRTIVDGLSADIGISEEQLDSRMYPLIISEVDFPRIYYNMMLLVLILVVIWAVYNIAYAVYCVARPWKLPHVRAGLGDKADRQMVRDIDEQLRCNIYYDQYGVVITDSYFIYHGIWRTDVVALDNIEHFRKLRTSANIGVGRKRIYKLLMKDVDGVTYEQNFKTEAALDEALSYLKNKELR